MSEQIQAPTKSRDLRAWIGYPLTGLYLLGLGAHLYVNGGNPLSLELNAMGDFLAGVFGPLAFLWLVLGYLQQGEELQQNTGALEKQERQLAHAAAEQHRLAEATLNLVELTRQQLQEERERHAAERAHHSDAIQPVFTLEGEYWEDHDDIVSWMVKIHNAGRECTRLMIAQVSAGGTKTETDKVSLLSHNQEKQLEIHTSKSRGVGTFVVSYRDADGIDQMQGFMAFEEKLGDNLPTLFFEALKDVFKPERAPEAVPG